jgi:hypothetical protein
MARQEDTCWRCGATWVSNDETPSRLRVIPGGAGADGQAITSSSIEELKRRRL